MNDPDGLTEHQRALVNDVHEAIRFVRIKTIGPEASGRTNRHDTAHRRVSAALVAADGAGVPRTVLEAAVRTAAAPTDDI